MFIVTTEQGQTFKAETFQGIVRAMRDEGWKHYDRKTDYMTDVASRVSSMVGRPIRTFPDGFIEDLEDAGLIMIETV